MPSGALQIKAISGRRRNVPGRGAQRDDEICKYIDVTTCIGCKACEVACVEWNDVPFQRTAFQTTYQTMPTPAWNYWNLITWLGLGFVLVFAGQVVNWRQLMAWTPYDTRWLRRLGRYITNADRHEPEYVGFFDAGQDLTRCLTASRARHRLPGRNVGAPFKVRRCAFLKRRPYVDRS